MRTNARTHARTHAPLCACSVGRSLPPVSQPVGQHARLSQNNRGPALFSLLFLFWWAAKKWDCRNHRLLHRRTSFPLQSISQDNNRLCSCAASDGWSSDSSIQGSEAESESALVASISALERMLGVAAVVRLDSETAASPMPRHAIQWVLYASTHKRTSTLSSGLHEG